MCPTIPIELFDKLAGVANPTLNVLFDIVGKCYLIVREKPGTLISALLSVYNFYLKTQEATNMTSLAVGFLDMMNNLFHFSTLPELFKVVSSLIRRAFNSLSQYFLRSEALESKIDTLWSLLDGKDSRSIINIVYELSAVSATCALIRNLYQSKISTGSISDIVDVVSEHFMNSRSEIRLRLKSATQAIARVIDYICLNYEFMLKGEFHKISWKLPGPIQFENDYAAFCALFDRYMINPFILEEENLTLINLRDRAHALIATANKEIIKTQVGQVKSCMVRYLQTLNHHHTYLEEQLNPNNTKPQPLSIVLYGPPGCGKSSIATSIGKLMQKIAGRTPDEDKIKNRGGDPKFEPAIQSNTEVIISDDFGNDMSAQIAAKEVLDIVNVTREVIPKASVEEKNKHRYSNIGAIFTTNDINVGIGQIKTISYESILRRFGHVIFIKPKEEYCIPGSEVLNRNHPYLSAGIDRADIYTLEIKRPITVKTVNNKPTVEYVTVENWRKEGLCDLKSFMIYIRKEWENEWKQNVAQHNNRNSTTRICPDCSLERLVCVCNECKYDDETDLVAESGRDLSKYYENFHEGLSTIVNAPKDYYNIFDNYAQVWLDIVNRKISLWNVSRLTLTTTLSLLRYLYENRVNLSVFGLLLILLAVIFPPFLYFAWILIIYTQKSSLYKSAFIGAGVLSLSYINPTLSIISCVTAVPILLWKRKVEIEKNRVIKRYQDTNQFIRQHYYGRMFFYAILGSATGYFSLLFGLKVLSHVFPRKGEAARDIASEPYMPVYKQTNSDDKLKYHFVPKPDNAAQTASRSDAVQFLAKKMLRVEIQLPNNETQTVSGIPMGSEILIPAHVLPPKGRFNFHVCADATKRTSGYTDTDMSRSSYTILKDRRGKEVDAALVHVSNIPVQPNLQKFFTSGAQPPDGPGQELYKYADGTSDLIDIRLSRPGHFEITRYIDTFGRSYSDYPTIKCTAQNFSSEQGMCGNPILSEYSNCILGIHVSGSGSKTWYGLRITNDMIEDARNVLKSESMNFISHPMPDHFVVKRTNNKQFEFDDTITERAVDSLGVNMSPIEEIGSVLRNGEIYADRAEKHYFTNTNPNLEAAFGPRNTQPPQYPNGLDQINSTLTKLHQPKFGVPIDLIDRAVDDYLNNSNVDKINFNIIIEELKASRDDFFSVRSLEEALRGDETGVVKGIKNSSSAGWIYGGKKTSHYNMDVEGDPLEIRDLVPEIRRDIHEQEISWRNGQGTFDPFKRCSKTNELLPLKKAEEKTRSFYANDMTFFINMMRGVLPLKHVLRKDTTLSECFVGVTPQSSDWRQLMNFLTRNGKFSNFVCGDFSGYDTQLPKALLDKAAWILLEMAKRGGMNKSDLEFLTGALTSVVSPTLFWQGHVLRMANGQPSGQPLTVEFNSIINSLLMRMVFYTIMDEEYPHLSNVSFRNYVALATYGDDNALGVDSSIPKYNHTKIQSVFARWGISYTMADKDADSVPYQTIGEVSFLKRSFKHHDDLGIVAPIEYDSIVKGFYYWVRPKNTPLTFPQQFGEFVKSQVREAALHGPEFYDRFCKGVIMLQEGSMQMKDEFKIKWNNFELPEYYELIEDLKERY